VGAGAIRPRRFPPGATHPIDAFYRCENFARADRSVEDFAGRGERKFHSTVLPILRDECFRCHGEKEKGALRFEFARAAALKGRANLKSLPWCPAM